MTAAEKTKALAGPAHSENAKTGEVLQVERRDFVDLVPDGRERVQPMRGFDPIYTDIVDYIVRCTHRIWDERDVGLIYTHYTHNPYVYLTTGTLYTREDVVRDTIQRLVVAARAARDGDAGDLVGQRPRRLLHLAPRHRDRAAHPARATTARRPGAPSSRGPSPTAWSSRTRSIASGSSPTRWRS